MRLTSAVKTGVLVSLLGLAACGEADTSADAPPPNQIAEGAHGLEVVARDLDSARGRALFVEKGCVVCHSVNGVGGKAATPLDAQIGAPPIDPLDFAARMWLGAPAMIELQSIELGYTIHLTADEIADLSAFSADVTEQKLLDIAQVPETVRGGFLDEQFWEVENWDDFLKSGQEAVDEIEADDQGGDR